eukprot:2817085-Lingulodinium_polyedra.AAC.1
MDSAASTWSTNGESGLPIFTRRPWKITHVSAQLDYICVSKSLITSTGVDNGAATLCSDHCP